MSDQAADTIAQGILTQLGEAWNAADGQAFGAPFAEDAVFVAIRGDLHQGRMAIAHGHQAILDTIYKGSTQSYELLQARHIGDGVVVAQARGRLNAPSGPMAGESTSTATLVLVREGDAWMIATFHNTLVAAG